MDRIVTFLLLLVAAVLLVPGCIAEEQAAPEVTEVAPEMNITEEVSDEAPVFDVTADVNTTALNMTQNQVVLVELPETSGFEWNVTLSDGLTLVDEIHVDAEEGVENGTASHQWFVEAVTLGEQTFTGVEKMAESEETGSEYTLNILVE